MSRKDDRLNDTVSLIRQAIRACGTDFATINVRAKLVAALSECADVSSKRERRENNSKRALLEAMQKAQTLNNEWWKKIEENVRESAKKASEEQAGPDLNHGS